MPRLLVAAVLAVLLVGCGGDRSDSAPAGESLVVEAGPEHVHGLGVNPADKSLYIATHSGLWRAATGQRKSSRVADIQHDLMGFTVVGPDRFLASGHPDLREELPPRMGLQRSTDAGRSWRTVSLLGEADLHVLRATGRRIYGVDSATGAFLTSADGGRSWQRRTPLAPVFDLAIAPRTPNRVVAATERGLISSSDAGRAWRPLRKDLAGLLAWPNRDALFLVDADGAVWRSANAGRTFEQVGSVGARPEAFAAGGARELYAAVHGGTVVGSTDGGVTWRTRSTP